MKYALKSKFGRFISDYGLIITSAGFIIVAILFAITGSMVSAICSIWLFLTMIMNYIDYKVEHLEVEGHRNREILLAEMMNRFEGLSKKSCKK